MPVREAAAQNVHLSIRPALMLSRSVQHLLLPSGSGPSSQASWQGLALLTRQETSSPKAETEARCPKLEAQPGSRTKQK